MEDENWALAMEILQYQLDRSGDASLILPDGSWTQVRSEADRLLGEFPEPALNSYRLQFGGSAQQLLQDAHAENDIAKVVEVANRYFHTLAGHEAANELGTFHFDRGEFGMAARWFARLANVGAEATVDPKWRIKAAFAFRQTGAHPASDSLIRDLKTSEDWQLELGGRPIDPAHWFDETGPLISSTAPVLDDWPLFLGTPSRTGTASGGEPVLVPRWSVPTTHSHAVIRQTEMLLEDLADQGVAAVPAFAPLMVRGKAIFRTLRGVQVVDVATGTPLWETEEDISPEVLLSGQRPQTRLNRRRGGNAGVVTSYTGGSGDRHPLTSLLFRNGTYGIIGCDEKRLFVIEDHALLSRHQPGHRAMQQAINDPYRRNWASNRIRAYDIESGRPYWQVGGPRLNEAFDPELSGTYFTGVPVRKGNELFVVGERDHEIRLFVLDPATGRLQWSTQIGDPAIGIERDFGRRWWTSQVAVSDGVAVCPTTVGWLVAVDRLNRSVLWARRYEDPVAGQENSRGEAAVTFESLNQRWAPSAPILIDGHVIYAPAEQNALYCIDLLDGHIQWRKPKQSFLYVAGVFDEKVLLVGADSIAAVSLESGADVWPAIQIPESAGKTSGMGVAAGHRYYLPLQTGELWAIDLQDGRVVQKSYRPAGNRALGNLAMHRGLLLSLNPFGLTAYEQRDVIQAEISRRLGDDPRDALALVRQAEIHLLERNYDGALAALRRIDVSEPKGTGDRHRAALKQSLLATIRSDLKRHDRELQELTDLAVTTDDEILTQRLAAEQQIARNEYEAAFELLWKLARRGDDRLVKDDSGQLNVRLDAWLAGKFADMWNDMPGDLQLFDRKVGSIAADIQASDTVAQEHFVNLFGFHPAAATVRRQLADGYANAGDVAKAESVLLKLRRSSDPRVAAAAVERLARLMRTAGLNNDSDYYYRLLERHYADVELRDAVPAAEFVGALREKGGIGDGDLPAPADWNSASLALSRIGTNHSQRYVQQLIVDAAPIPFFRDHCIEVDRQRQRLAVVRTSDNAPRWLLPLRGNNSAGRDLVVAGRSAGHLLFVLHRDVLHCLSPVERRVLWTAPLDPRGRASRYYRAANRGRKQPLQAGTRILARNSLLQRARRMGMLAVVNDDYVCVYGRREITVYDSTTGDVRWSYENRDRSATVVGNEHALFIVPADRGQAVALRSIDGARLNIPNIGKLVGEALDLTSEGLVLVDSQSAFFGLSRPRTVVRMYDPLTDTEHWKRSWASDVYLGRSEDGDLIALSPSGKLQRVERKTGRLTEFDAAPDRVKDAAEIFTLSDPHTLYLLVNDGDDRRFRTNSQELPSIRVSGLVAAYDVQSGRHLWNREVASQNLVLQGTPRSPLLVFASKEYVQEPENRLGYWRMNLLVLDRRTGETRIESSGSGNYAFQSISVNPAERFVELRTNNQILRLQADSDSRAGVE